MASRRFSPHQGASDTAHEAPIPPSRSSRRHLITISAGVSRLNSRIDVGMAALLAALVILPLYPKVGLIGVGGTYIPVRLDDFVTIAVLGGWAFTLYRARRLPRVPPIAPAVLAWLSIGLLALALGAAWLGTIAWSTGALFWAKPVEYLALGWVAYDLVDRPERLRLVLYAIFATASVVIAYALLERFGWVPPAPNYATDVTARRGALGSTMGDQHQLATYLGIVILIGIALWHRAPRAAKMAGIVGLGASAYVLAHAAGRSEFLSLAACSFVLAAWRPARLPAVVMLSFLAISFILPSGIEKALDDTVGHHTQPLVVTPSPGTLPGGSSTPSVPTPPISVADRVDDLEADRSLQIRLQERWPMFLKIAMRDPIFGAGPSAATEAADGYYIRSFTEVGLVGTLAFGAVILSVVLALRRVVRLTVRDPRAAGIGLLAATLFIALVGVLIDSWVASRVMQLYWPAIGATIASLASRHPSPSRPEVESGLAGLADTASTG
jgi:hypothetical protein